MYFLILDIGYKKIDHGIYTDSGQNYLRGNISINFLSIEELINVITEIYENYIRIVTISGICISCTGIIDSKNGTIIEVHRLPFLNGFRIKDYFEKVFQLPVTIENNAKCTALAEVWFGNARNHKDYIYLTMEYGVGGAVVKNKKIHHGSNLYAGEFGLMLFNSDKKGQYNRWGDLVSLIYLIEKCKKILGFNELSWDKLYTNYNFGLVKEEIDDYFRNIALGLYNLQFLYDPEVILIDNKLGVLNEINKNIIEIGKSFEFSNKIPIIKECELTKDSRLIGALFNYLFAQS